MKRMGDGRREAWGQDGESKRGEKERTRGAPVMYAQLGSSDLNTALYMNRVVWMSIINMLNGLYYFEILFT